MMDNCRGDEVNSLDGFLRWMRKSVGTMRVPTTEAEVREAERRMASEPPVELPERLKTAPPMPPRLKETE
jgi:hypothetical protein